MKKISICFLLAISFLFIQATEASYVDGSIKVGSYFPSYHKTRRIFSNGTLYYQLEVAAHFGNPWEIIPWQAWICLGFLPQNNSNHHLEKARLYPLSVGLKYIWYYCDGGEFSLGAGPALAWFRMKDKSVTPRRYIVKQNSGVDLKSSIRYWFNCDFFGEIFLDYLIMNFGSMHHKHRHHNDSENGFFNFSNLSEPFPQHPHMKSARPRRLDMNAVIMGGGLGTTF